MYRVIQELSATLGGVSAEDIIGPSRLKWVVIPRHVAIFICREDLQMSFGEIAFRFKRNHSTVMSAHRKAKWHVNNTPGYGELLGEVRREVARQLGVSLADYPAAIQAATAVANNPSPLSSQGRMT
jgi:chromosomal replication initiator protein